MPFLATCNTCGRESHVPDCAHGAQTWCPRCTNFFAPARAPALPRCSRALPFLASCVGCGRLSYVPASALGAPVWCPSCSSYFLLAPPRATTEVQPPAPAVAVLETLPAAVVTLPQTAAVEQPVCIAAPVAPSAPTPAPQSRPADEESDEEPRAIDPLGAAALFLGCAALLCASFTWLCWLLVPLSLAALVAGVTALVRAVRSGQARLLFPTIGTAVPTIVLGLGLFLPGVLGPAYRASRERDDWDPTAIRRVALAGTSAGAGLEDPVWADASRYALVQGPLQIEVIQVSVERLDSAANPKSKPETRLLIRLRIQQAAQSSAVAVTAKSAAPKQEAQATLTDASGTAYALVDVKLATAPTNDRGAAVFRMAMSTVTFVFEAPPADVSTLRLEVPAVAWGGSGAFRFAVPGTMIQRKTGG